MFQTLFHSEDVPAQERFERWRELTTKAFMPTDETSECTDSFEASARTLELGTHSLGALTFRPLQIRRPPKLVRKSDPEIYHLVLPLHGCLTLDHVGRSTAVGAGGMVLFDSSQPYRAAVTASQGFAEFLHVQFPKALSPLAPGRLNRLVGERLSGREGIGAMFSDFLIRLGREADQYRPADTARLGGILLDVLTVLLARELDAEASAPAESRGRALMLSVPGFIERHLGDARLSPQTIAAAHQISVSYLYKLFHEEHLTVAAYIRERRLESCRRDLADPRLGSRPVHTIAARWGFTSNAHFSRAFRAAYGTSPTDYRHAAVDSRCVEGPSTTVQGQSTTC
ncbi:AraC-like ligand-binding domain-containing protein [Streptomyces jumonjinensis]|uniref:AraC-like ligand-binding domain-containing protein n=1 Tax=Streptomyces jumonjinensis TaxID=1945 RepID=UPI0037AD791E